MLTFLLATAELMRIVGAGGERLLDRKPVFSVSTPVNLDLPGTVPTAPGFMLMLPADVDSLDPTFRRVHHVDPKEARVVDEQGAPYTGDLPYVVLAVDGAVRDELKEFAPTQASAAILSRFLGIREGQQEPLSPLLDALKLYNDVTYRRRVDELDKRISGLPDGTEKDALKKDRDALHENIQSDLLKKSAGT